MIVIRALPVIKKGLFNPTQTLLDNTIRNGLVISITNRTISSLEITKNLELLSKEKKNAKVTNLKLSVEQDKPLVILLSWLLAKRKHINKYAEIYFNRGFDVLNVSVTPWQLLWPSKGTQVVAQDLLKFIELNKSYQPLVLHGFSVGGYVWGEVLVKIAQEKDRYKPVVDRISGQVWDSVADITEIAIGVPVAVFPRNRVMQNALRQYMLYHLKTFHKIATSHYVRSSQMFHTNLVHAPALFFLSKSDPIGAVSSNTRARESWESTGIQVYWKCWDKSPHVGHYRHHPQEYVSELNNFIDRLDVAQKEKVKVKL